MQNLRDCVLELVKNSIEANSTFIEIRIFQKDARRLILQIEDDGDGIDSNICELCQSPFYSTKNKEIGMGLPMVKELAMRTGGNFAVECNKNGGITVSALFKPYNINMIPIGDIYRTTVSLIKAYNNIDFVLYQKTGNTNITIDSRYSKSNRG